MQFYSFPFENLCGQISLINILNGFLVKRISHIGSLVKRIYRIYSVELLSILNEKGFTDLRASFLEILSIVCEKDGPSIKSIGDACGLKKQTMTSHLNDLEKRGYIYREVSQSDKREQRVFLTEYGQKFKFALYEAKTNLENQYSQKIGNVEMERVEFLLENFHDQLRNNQLNQFL